MRRSSSGSSGRHRAIRGRCVLVAVVAAVLSVTFPAASAHAASAWQTLTFGSERFEVPSTWPVRNLAADPSQCVRFDRHAVYEGNPDATSSCPARLAGVTEAVQLQSLDALGQAQSGPDLHAATIGSQEALVNVDPTVSHRLVAQFPAAGLLATISFGSDRATAERILDSFRFAPSPAAVPSAPAVSPRAPSTEGPAPGAAVGTDVSVGPVTMTGKGFDTCAAPSEATMSAWRNASPYRAAGVYIGGANRACGDGNLSASWVDTEVAAGWDLIPLYVGLQASCADQAGLASISAASATTEGTQAAADAAAQAGFFGMGRGSPIYYDMEAWNTSNASCSDAVVTFVRAWDGELVRKGFVPGIYGSVDSGIAQDIAPLSITTGQPADIDLADWDGQANTSSPYLSSTEWPGQHRIKQYQGGVDQTYGGVEIDVDQDDVNSAVVGNQRPGIRALSPAAAAVGTTVTVAGRGFVAGATSVHFGGVAAHGVTVSSSRRLTALVPARSIGTVAVTVTTKGGSNPPVHADQFRYIPIVATAVDAQTGGYRLATSRGNVYSFGAPWLGSPAAKPLAAPIVGMAADTRTGGYWLVSAAGNVYNYDAAFSGSPAGKALPSPVVGIAADPRTGGYWLVTAKGNVYNYDAPWYGSPAGKALPSPVVGIAADPSGDGYWLVTAKGNVYNFGAPWYGSPAGKALPAPVVGIAADPSGDGYWLATAKGNLYAFGAPWYGSAADQKLPAGVVSVVADRNGYLLTSAAGNVDSFNTEFHGSPARAR